jgi:hypothetical protein
MTKRIPKLSYAEKNLIKDISDKYPSTISVSTNRNKYLNMSQQYVMTVQNTPKGMEIAEDVRNTLRHSGRTVRFRGRHSDRKGLLEKGLVSNTYNFNDTCDVRHVPIKHSERFDVYVCADGGSFE